MQHVRNVALQENSNKLEQGEGAFSIVDILESEGGEFLVLQCMCLLDTGVSQ